MRFSYAESMCDPAHMLPLAQACDVASVGYAPAARVTAGLMLP